MQQLLAASGNPDLQADLILELHSSLLSAERLIANLQDGKAAASKQRNSGKAGLVHENMDLLKVCTVSAAWLQCSE